MIKWDLMKYSVNSRKKNRSGKKSMEVNTGLKALKFTKNASVMSERGMNKLVQHLVI